MQFNRQGEISASLPVESSQVSTDVSSTADIRKVNIRSALDWDMIKSELIETVARAYPYLHLKDAERIVDAILEEMAEALMRGDRVELRGFGALSIRHRPQRSGRNPRTNKAIFVEEKWVPFFRASKDMQHRLNADSNPDERRTGSSPAE